MSRRIQFRQLAACSLAVACLVATTHDAWAVDVWVTKGDRSEQLRQRPDVVFENGLGTSGIAIIVDPSQTFQTIEGYGASMTNSSAELIQNELNSAQRDRLMRELFSSDDGIGLNYLRVPMGASDFTATGFYTYNDLPAGQTDADQSEFSIAPDQATILPSLDDARAQNPGLRLMASPWSAPGWMKTSGSVIGGSLAPQWQASYALYLRKFAEAYEAEGHPIDTLTLQNEPLFTPNNYPGMFMSSVQQIDLIKNHVGPELAAAGLPTQIIAYDHNWDDTAYPIAVLDDPDARQYVAGTAFHGYAGNVSAQTVVRNAHPDKQIYFTEISGGDFAPNFEDNLVWYARNLFIGGARNWGSTVLFWNLALDQNSGPHLGGCGDCRGVVTIDTTTGDATPNEEFYSLGHASQVVQPGAVRIQSTSINNLLETVAFQNPDGSEVLIALNPTTSDQDFRLVRGTEHVSYSAPARSVATFFWEPGAGADFDNGGFERGGYDTTGGSIDGWLRWGAGPTSINATNDESLTGEHSLMLSGPGGGGGFAGVSHGITVEGGDDLRVDASVLLPLVGSIAGTANSVLMKIEYYDEHGGAFQSPEFLGQTEITVADGTTATGAWSPHSIEDTAPAGAKEARLVFVFSQPSGQAGSVRIDDVSFGLAPTLAGDFNGDGVVDALDYVYWREGQDPNLTPASFDEWRANYGAVDSASAPSQSVPEPTAAGLTISGAILSWLLPRQR